MGINFSWKFFSKFLSIYSTNQRNIFWYLQYGKKTHRIFGGQEKDLFQTAFGAFTLNYHPLKETKLSLIASGFRTNEKETYDISGEYILSEVKWKMIYQKKQAKHWELVITMNMLVIV